MIIHKQFMVFMKIYETIHNTTKKRRVLIVFDDMIADMEYNKILSPKVNEFF